MKEIIIFIQTMIKNKDLDKSITSNWYQYFDSEGDLIWEYETWKKSVYLNSAISYGSPFSKLLYIPKFLYQRLLKYIWISRPRLKGRYFSNETKKYEGMFSGNNNEWYFN